MINSKRKTIKLIASGSALATLTEWRKPIIDSVVLPAHAETSECIEADLLGEWVFRVGGDLLFGVQINENGEAFVQGTIPASWEFDGMTFILESPSVPLGFSASFTDDSCNVLVGVQGVDEEVVGEKL